MAGFFRHELVYTLILMLGSMSFGLTTAYYSPARESLLKDLQMTETQGTIFNSLVALCSIFGGFAVMFLIKKFERKVTILITAITAAVSWILLAICKPSFKLLVFFARGFLGLTVGAFSSVIPMYITEIAPSDVRGAYGVLNQLGVVAGNILCFGLGVSYNWNTIAYISCIPASFLIFLIWIVPSPPSTKAVVASIDEPLFTKKYSKSLTNGLLLMFFQQFSGCNALGSNYTKIFSDCGSKLSPKVATLLVGMAGFFSTALASPFVQKFGRKPSWNTSSIGQAIPLLLIALDQWIHISAMLPFISLFLSNFLFGLGLGPVPWFVVPELFPDSVRPRASSWMTASNWFFAMITMIGYPYMQNLFGMGGSMMTLSVVCMISAVYGFFFMPDTGGQVMGGDSVSETPLISKN